VKRGRSTVVSKAPALSANRKIAACNYSQPPFFVSGTKTDNSGTGTGLQDRSGRRCSCWEVEFHHETLQE